MVPIDLQTTEFLRVWQRFESHREKMKEPMTELAAMRILKKCSAWGAWYARILLDLAIRKGWQAPVEPEGYRTHELDGFKYVWGGLVVHRPEINGENWRDFYYYNRRAV